MALSSLHFTVFYTLLSTPLISFGSLYTANLLYFFCKAPLFLNSSGAQTHTRRKLTDVGIYGLAACVAVAARREDGPLLAMIVCLITGVFSGYGPTLADVKEWHLEWFWRMFPGVCCLSLRKNALG